MTKNKDFAQKALQYVGYGPTSFRKWYYGNDLKNVPWCAIFVSYIANEVNILNKIVKKCDGAGDFARLGVKANWGQWYEGNTKPQIGDIVTFTWNGQGRYPDRDAYFSDHVGIVYKVDGKYIYTVEGNTNGTNDTSTVSKRTYALYSGLINGYYRPNWSAVEKNNTKKEEEKVPTIPNITYRVRAGGKWLPEVKNLEDYAGIRGKAITDIAIKSSNGTVKYKVRVNGKWLPYVTGYNINDYNNGYAGNGKPFDAIKIYYSSPKEISKTIGYLKMKYRVSPINKNYYDWQYDEETKNGQDGYAGSYGILVDRIQMILSK